MPTEKIIYLTWKPAAQSERFIIARLSHEGNTHRFSYLPGPDLDKARQLGFMGYPSFPDLKKEYTQNVIESFGSRIPARARTDFGNTLKLWKIENPQISDFDFLAATGGELATDHFRFIDPHEEAAPTSFLSRVAGFVYNLDVPLAKQVPPGAPLSLTPEDTNAFDPKGIRLDWNNRRIGYLTKLHAQRVRQSLEKGERVDAKLEHLGVNGVVNLVIAKISLQPASA